jgi:hypothetical protein
MEFPDWLTKIKQARKRDELFAILDDFRTGEWTDEQRATVGRLYIRLLENMQPAPDAPPPGASKVPVAAPSGAAKVGASGGTGADGSAGAAAVKTAADGESEADGPVWYEKM